MLTAAGGLLYLGLVLLLGGVFARRVLTPHHPEHWVLGAGVLLLGLGTGLTLWGTLAAVGMTSAADLLAYLTQTAAGRALLLLMLGALVLLATELSGWPLVWALAAGALTLWGLAGAGHGATHGPTVRLLHGLHAGAMCVWLGGVLALATLRGVGAADAAQFTPIATACVGTLVLTGTFATLEHTGRLWGVWDSSYGRVLILKLGVVALALLAALWVRQTLARARSPRAHLALEFTLLILVLGVTAVLSQTPPPVHDMDQMHLEGQ